MVRQRKKQTAQPGDSCPDGDRVTPGRSSRSTTTTPASASMLRDRALPTAPSPRDNHRDLLGGAAVTALNPVAEKLVPPDPVGAITSDPGHLNNVARPGVASNESHSPSPVDRAVAVMAGLMSWWHWSQAPGVSGGGKWPWNIFEVDLRSLAVWRVGLGVYMVLDVLSRWEEVDIWYTDDGLATRQYMLEQHYLKNGLLNTKYFWHSNAPISLYMMVGHTMQIKALFIIQSFVAVLLIVGYKTQITVFVAWFMHMSMHARSPVIQNKGEELSVRLLLWATVLPTGARWSIDSWRRDRAIAASSGADKAALLSSAAVRHTGAGFSFRGVASMGVFLQAFSLYYTTGLMKSGADWNEGWAAHSSLLLRTFAKDNIIANTLRDNPWLCYYANHSALFGEVYGIYGIFGPPRVRLLAIILLSTMQLSFYFTLLVYLFPHAATLTVVPLLPGIFWTKVCPKTVELLAPAAEMVARLFCSIMDIATTRRPRSQPTWTIRESLRETIKLAIHTVAVWCILVPMVAWSLHSIELIPHVPRQIRLVGLSVGSAQKWNMFAPTVKDDDAFLFLPGVLKDGTEVDAWPIIQRTMYPDQESLLKAAAWRGDEYKEHPIGEYRWPNPHWIMYLSAIHRKKQNFCEDKRNPRCPRFAEHVCREWKKRFADKPGKQLMALKIVVSNQLTVRGNCSGCARKLDIFPRTLWAYGCVGNLNKPPYHVYPPRLHELIRIEGQKTGKEAIDRSALGNTTRGPFAGDGK